MRGDTRDPGIQDLVDWLNEDHKRNKWESLTPKEWKVISYEIERCRDDFRYAARNYFWISTKSREDVLFRLNESQELLYEKIAYLRKRGQPQKLMIVKARQLGNSTFVEALGAWKVFFNRNVNALVVSHDEEHSAYLFSIPLHIFDMLPWWMRPSVSSREMKSGLVLDTDGPDKDINPGLNSRFKVQMATQPMGVGQGMRINFFHGSEYSEWKRGAEIIDGDLGLSLVEDVDTIAILESTAKGAGNYSHKLWLKNLELGDKAEWMPVFLPWFFDSQRTRVVMDKSWMPEKPEREMADQVRRDWTKCDNPACASSLEARWGGRLRTGAACPVCQKGHLQPYELSRDQLNWIHHKRLNADRSPETMREFRQELPTTGEEAFQISGTPLFADDIRQYVASTIIDPLAAGFFDHKGTPHGMNAVTGRCIQDWCTADHANEFKPLKIWETPQVNMKYVIGVDTALGYGGTRDYSVAFVNKVSHRPGVPDAQVALFRTNTMDEIELARQVAFLGYYYNTAMVAVELNRDTTFQFMRSQLQYPNFFKFKNVTHENQNSNRLGWITNAQTKPRLLARAVNWLRGRLWVIRSRNFHSEMLTFNRDEAVNAVNVGAAADYHDDELMAGMIALYCSHDMDWEEDFSYAATQKKAAEASPQSAEWSAMCSSCSNLWGAETIESVKRCPKCGSLRTSAKRNVNLEIRKVDDLLSPDYPSDEPEFRLFEQPNV